MMESQPLQEPTAAAPAAGEEAAGAPPAVVPGKEFTRTCKGLVVVLIGGYVLLQLLPSSLNYLAIIPSKYLLACINHDAQRNYFFPRQVVHF